MSVTNLSGLTMADVQQMLRVCREERNRLVAIEIILGERIKTVGDGEKSTLQRELVMVGVEITSLSDVIQKLWTLLGNIREGRIKGQPP